MALNSPVSLEQTGTDRFVARGGPCDGNIFVVCRSAVSERKPQGASHELAELDDGLRGAAHGRANMTDLEDGVLYEVRTDSPKPFDHHQGNDARLALETFLATEAMARVVEGGNRMPMISRHALTTLRSLRPNLPEPSPRIPVWPLEEWTADIDDFWVLDQEAKHISLLDMQNLLVAAEQAPTEAVRALSVTRSHHHELGGYYGYGWYTALPSVASIKPERKVREVAKETGVHIVPRIRIEVRATREKTPRRIDAPLWLSDRDTLVVRKGFEPTVDLIARMFSRGLRGSYRDMEAAERYATELLGQAGDRAMHEALEHKFQEYIRSQIGNELDVSITIKPKDPE